MFNLYPILPFYLTLIFLLIFILILLVYFYFSIKNYLFRILIFSSLLFLSHNPMINDTGKSYYNDVLIVVSDKTQSITETKKLKSLLNTKKNIIEKTSNIENLDVIEITVDSFFDYSEGQISSTEIISSLQKEFQKVEKNRIAGIIIITDGIIHDLDKINSAFDNIPLHFLIVGEKSERDRAIITKNVPEYAIVGKEVELSFKIKDENFSNRIKTSFILDGIELTNKLLEPNIIHTIKIPISHAGENLLEVKINKHPEEISLANNSKTFRVNGIHEKLRVMLISGEPNMGLRTWRNILNSDPAIELLHFTILRPPSKRDLTPVKELSLIPFPTQELFSADISKFSLIILDQYTLQGILPKKYLDNIVNFVLDGGAILNISGPEYMSTKSLNNSPLATILPTKPKETYTGPLLPLLTAIGKRHPISNDISNSYKIKKWGNWYSFIKTTKVAGITLLEQEDGNPLMVINQVSKGRVAQILSDQSWVWAKDTDNKGPLIKLLRNTIHWLLKTPELEENFLDVQKDKDIITLNLNTLTEGDTGSIITTPSKKNIPVLLKDESNGNLTGKFKSSELGKFRLKINDLEKFFYLGLSNNKEIEELKSSEENIKVFFEKNNSFMHSINWIEQGIPKIVKVYNKINTSGKNWIGLIEKKASKSEMTIKLEFINWYIKLSLLLLLLFSCWYREGK